MFLHTQRGLTIGLLALAAPILVMAACADRSIDAYADRDDGENADAEWPVGDFDSSSSDGDAEDGDSSPPADDDGASGDGEKPIADGDGEFMEEDMEMEEESGPELRVNADIMGRNRSQIFLAGFFIRDEEEGGFVRQFSGVQWTTVYETPLPLWGTWGMANGHITCVGEQGIVATRSALDQSWSHTQILDEPTLMDVWGWSEDYIFAAGQGLFFFDGSAWTPIPYPEGVPAEAGVRSIWGASKDNVYAVGFDGLALHFDGVEWTRLDLGTDLNLNRVWGWDENNIFIVGGSEEAQEHVVFHYDGVEWTTIKTGGPDHLLSVNGRSATDVLVVGGRRNEDRSVIGTVYRWDGGKWTSIPTEARDFLWDVYYADDGTFFAIGPGNTIIEDLIE